MDYVRSEKNSLRELKDAILTNMIVDFSQHGFNISLFFFYTNRKIGSPPVDWCRTHVGSSAFYRSISRICKTLVFVSEMYLKAAVV